MESDLIILILEAMVVYIMVLWAHSLRRRFGSAHFFALLGGITAIMSWLTDAGVKVEFMDITFMVGSTVFYTALLLGVFVVYVFDGPRSTRIAISTVAGVSAMVPLITAVIHVQMHVAGHADISYVPVPDLRINAASVLTTIADLFFLAISWEFLGKPRLRVALWVRAFLTLLGVMALDVIMFNSLAFIGSPNYLSVMTGTLVSRLIICVFACPLLYIYLKWQNSLSGVSIENRPVLAILREVAEVRAELSVAHQEIERRKQAEREREQVIEQLEASLTRVRKLEGLLPVCSSCRRIHIEDAKEPEEEWVSLEDYVQRSAEVEFSHGMCGECMDRLYPDLAERVRERQKSEEG